MEKQRKKNNKWRKGIKRNRNGMEKINGMKNRKRGDRKREK